MKRHRKFSISKILSIYLTFTVVVISLVTFSVSHLIMIENIKTRLEKKADELISSLAVVLEMPLWDVDEQSIKMTGEAYASNKLVEQLKISDEMGNVYFDYARENNGATASRSSQIMHNGLSIGLVEISLTTRPYTESNTRSLLSSIVSIVLIVLLLLLVTRFFSRILLNRLNDTLGRVVNAYYSGTHDSTGYDMPFLEFLPLVSVLDDMKTKIDSQMMKLRNAEKKYRELIELAQEGIWVIDKDNNTTFANPSMARMLGYAPDEMKGKNLFSFMDEAGVEIAKANLERRKKGLAEQHDFEFLRKDGHRVITAIATAPILDEEDNYKGAIAGVLDITGRKRLEEELLRVEKLESLGILAGGLAHDFNNILTIIIGNISMTKTQLAPEDELFDLLNEAEMASTRAQTLTTQLLTFAKGGAPVKETASIEIILKESSSFVLRGSKSNCELSIAKDLWTVEVDVGQISQVINNAVINANQAMPEGGSIQLAAENLIIANEQSLLLKQGKYIRISIKDQGVGIAKKHLANIFDPYFTTKQEGSGLGLATAYSIIKKHQGHITVESQLGVGTTFHIYLPASGKAVPEKEKIKSIKGQGRILVMDDEVSLKKMLGRMLETLGYESEFAVDGAEAIRMVKEAKESGKPYDAVILDLTIPGGMGGKEAINKLLEIDPELKAIVSSGYSDDPVLANFREYGFKGVMPKPFESRSLGEVLHEVLKGEKK